MWIGEPENRSSTFSTCTVTVTGFPGAACNVAGPKLIRAPPAPEAGGTPGPEVPGARGATPGDDGGVPGPVVVPAAGGGDPGDAGGAPSDEGGSGITTVCPGGGGFAGETA